MTKTNAARILDNHNYDNIFVSAGKRGLQLKITPYDLIKVTSGHTGDLLLLKKSLDEV